MPSKDKGRVTPESTSMNSDGEMETSFSSYNTTTVKGISNPMYDAGADSSDTELSHAEDGLKSKGRGLRQRVPEIHAR